MEVCGLARVESVVIDSIYQNSRTVNEYGYLVDTIAKRRGAIASLRVFWVTSFQSTGEVCPKEPLPVKVSKARSVRVEDFETQLSES